MIACDIVYFTQVNFISFSLNCIDDRLQQFLTTSFIKKISGPNLGLIGLNQLDNV